MTGQSEHDFDPVTLFCNHCGVSMSAVAGSGVSCYPDTTNLVALAPFQARAKFEDMGLGPVMDAIEDKSNGRD